MKFNTMIRTGVAAATSLAAALGMGACSRDYTADYVYSISSSTGAISAYAVDYQSGILTQIEGSPFATQLTNPGSITSTPSGKYVYAIGGTQNAQVEPFTVGTDGKIYGEATVNISGTYPLSATVDSTGTWLFVTYRYQTQYSPASPGPGGVSVFKINSDGTLATPINVNLGVAPVSVTVTPPVCTSTPLAGALTSSNCTSGQTGNVFVYIAEQASSTQGQVIGFSLNNSTGALTLLPGNTCTGTPTVCTGTTAGIAPSAITAEPTGRYLYVTDENQNEVFGFTLGSSSNAAIAGTLVAMTSSPYTTGLYPIAVVVEPRGKYLYTANYNASTVSSFNISSADGSLGGTASTGSFQTGTNPICLTIDPALGIYLYTADYLPPSYVSGGQLNPNTGQLTAIATSPFPTSTEPTCLTSVANGARASQIVNPN